MTVVSLLTDYGHDDPFVGICHGVIAGIAPDARVIDVTHGVPRFDVHAGAITLRDALPFLPAGVHVAVVDPQVGSERRAVAVLCGDGRLLVGPDNGVLSLAWERVEGAQAAVDITRSPHRLEPVSATFHGRDLFAPVAAALAAGAPFEEAGEPLDPDSLEQLLLSEPRIEAGVLVAHVLFVDSFGNATLDVDHETLAGTELRLGRGADVIGPAGSRAAVVASTFADVEVGALVVYEDASRRLAVAVNRGDAAGELGLGPDTEVRIAPR